MKKIKDNYDNQNRFQTFSGYLQFLKVGTEDGWIRTNNREWKKLRKLLKLLGENK